MSHTVFETNGKKKKVFLDIARWGRFLPRVKDPNVIHG